MVFVMINASDNPKMVALLLFVQVVVPLLQSSAGSETSSALDVTALILLGLTFYLFWRIFVYLQTLRELHMQVSALMRYRSGAFWILRPHTLRMNSTRTCPGAMRCARRMRGSRRQRSRQRPNRTRSRTLLVAPSA